MNTEPGAFLWRFFRRRPTLPHSYPCSTIGAKGLNFRVRDGYRVFPLRYCHRKKLRYKLIKTLNPFKIVAKPHGLLVPVSSTHYCDLHTRPINLVVFKGPSGHMFPYNGISYLEVGFPLRCFQRLSFPNLATQLCRWRDNWTTIGSSIPVLSY